MLISIILNGNINHLNTLLLMHYTEQKKNINKCTAINKKKKETKKEKFYSTNSNSFNFDLSIKKSTLAV